MAARLELGVSVPLRILNVVRFPIGGIRNYLRYTYSRLDVESYATTIVTVNRPEADLLLAGLAPLDVEVKTVPETRAFLGLALAVDRLLRTGDFGLVHSQGSTAAVVSALSARRHGLPHVVTLHETFRAEQFSGVLGEAKRRLLAWLFGQVDSLVTVSHDARENLLRHLPLDPKAARRVEVIRNGVAVDTLLREAAETQPGLRARWGIGPDVVLLGYVGRFMPEKGFDVLLEAVGRLRRQVDQLPRFLVVAVNDGAFVREYRQAISEAGLDPWFLFPGFQSSAAGTIVELDAVVMPSRREACPLLAMEAMVLGRPLIASDCIGLRELTAGAPALTSTAGDPASLATSIVQFLRDGQRARDSALAYVETAREAFDSARSAESLAALFNKALASRRPRRRAAA
jgi:glycosyltransferase involved in cell wall biosynthesis